MTGQGIEPRGTWNMLSGIRSTLSLWQYQHWILFLLLVPFVNLAFPLLPGDLLGACFILHPAAPAIVPMFLVHYTHASLSRLSAGLTLYLLALAAILLLEQRTRYFTWIALSYLLVLPLYLSLFSLLVPGSTAGGGFIGIASAFAGYLVYLALYRKTYRRFVDHLLTRWWHGPSRGKSRLLGGLALVDALVLAVLLSALSSAARTGLTGAAGLALGLLIPLLVELRKRGFSSSNLAFLAMALGAIALQAVYALRGPGQL